MMSSSSTFLRDIAIQSDRYDMISTGEGKGKGGKANRGVRMREGHRCEGKQRRQKYVLGASIRHHDRYNSRVHQQAVVVAQVIEILIQRLHARLLGTWFELLHVDRCAACGAEEEESRQAERRDEWDITKQARQEDRKEKEKGNRIQ